jgi:superfamily II DNA/RNA helicase
VGKALVFASTKRMCEDLANQLHHSGVSCAAIHGDKDTT